MDCLSKRLMVLNFFLLLLWLTRLASAAAAAAALALARCQDKCGNISIPYPFGIGAGCYRKESGGYEIICNDSFRPPRPFIRSTKLEVLQASFEQVQVRTSVAYSCFTDSKYNDVSITLNGTPFTISETRNKFFSLGCNATAILETCKESSCNGTFCFSSCPSGKEEVKDASCNGTGCCSVEISKQLKKFYAWIAINRGSNRNSCGYAFVGDHKGYQFSKTDLSVDYENFSNKIRDEVPVVLDWVVGNETCEGAQNKSTYACRDNSNCSDSTNGVGYRCKCLDGYEGNPYLPQGCQDIDECKGSAKNECFGECINSPGGYHCSCPEGTYGDGKRDGTGCIKKKIPFQVIKIILGAGLSLVLVFGVPWFYWGLKQRRLMKIREKFFKQNGGLILQQHISLQQGAIVTHQIFTEKELEKATDKYNKSRIVGKGGYGTVYKGILSDSRVVAIKKAKIVDKSQIEQFINEIKILSQINHRNVVKLLGSCLETEVPLLVYEYVVNGTLFHHIHGDGHVSLLSWDTRLRIASETAVALTYLHSEASIPIIHRDVKSSNILLDDNYSAKVSDFGASRLIAMDKAELTTLVQGTLGYLDPEYLLTSQLTEKSDVYSFGVVLVELLTGQVPFSFLRSEEERSLCQYFILSMKEHRLYEILDSRVVDEGVKEQIVAVAELAKRCLEVKGDERPTMKEVAAELDGLRRFEKRLVQRNEEEMGILLGEQLEHEAGSTSGYDSINRHAISEIDMPR